MSVRYECDRCRTSCAADGTDDVPKLPRTWRRVGVPLVNAAGQVLSPTYTKTLCTACVSALAEWVAPLAATS